MKTINKKHLRDIRRKIRRAFYDSSIDDNFARFALSKFWYWNVSDFRS